MRRVFLGMLAGVMCLSVSQIASAADMPVKALVKMPAMYDWTGLYIGIHGGPGTGTSRWVDGPPAAVADLGSHNISGGLAGAQIGYNWQTGAWVFGLEGDASWANLTGNHVDAGGSDLHTKNKSLFSVAGRAGYAWDRALLYVKGGGAWGSFDYVDYVAPGGAVNGANSSTRSGWLIGGGLEYAIYNAWSVKVEYNYFDFGSKSLNFGGGVGGAFIQTITDRISVVKFGINYHFGR